MSSLISLGDNGLGNNSSSGSLNSGVVNVGGVTITKLTRENYSLWVVKMKLILQSLDLWDVVSGAEAQPADADLKIKWLLKDSKAKVYICLAVVDSILPTVSSLNTSKEVWSQLEAIYRPKTLLNRIILRKQLLGLRMEEGGDLASHLTQLKTLSDQLVSIGAAMADEDLVESILISLPPSYESLSSQHSMLLMRNF
jgi:hypothetical protein